MARRCVSLAFYILLTLGCGDTVFAASPFPFSELSSKAKVVFYRGRTPETRWIEYGWYVYGTADRNDETFFPFQRAQTAACELTTYGGNFIHSRPLMCKGRAIVEADMINIEMAYPEKKGLPKIIIVGLSNYKGRKDFTDYAPSYVLDMGVSPPFISPTPLDFFFPMTGNPFEYEHASPPAFTGGVRRIDADTYEFFGKYIKDIYNDKAKPRTITYRYSRKDRQLTLVSLK